MITLCAETKALVNRGKLLRMSCVTLPYFSLGPVPSHDDTSRYAALRYTTPRYSTLQFGTLLYVTLRYVTLRYVTLRYVTLRYITLRYVTLRYVTLRYVTLCYVTLRYVTLRCVTLRCVWRCGKDEKPCEAHSTVAHPRQEKKSSAETEPSTLWKVASLHFRDSNQYNTAKQKSRIKYVLTNSQSLEQCNISA